MINFRPTKHDLKQLSFLVKRNVTVKTTLELLDISDTEFDKWKKHKEVARIIQQVPDQPKEKFNIYHPDIADAIEEAFEVGLVKYYRFKSEFRLPVGRYKYHYKYMQLNALRIDPELLKVDVKEAKSWLTGERKKIDINNCHNILSTIEARASLPFDPELAEKLASVSFFTDQEDLSTYDEEEGKRKIKFWKDNNFNGFFLTMPVQELLNLKDISTTSLEEYLIWAKQIMEDLNESRQKLSSEPS